MSNGNAAQQQQDKPNYGQQIRELKQAFSTLVRMVLPAQLRQNCECGLVCIRQVTAVKPGVTGKPEEPNARTFQLCDSCKLPEGWNQVGSFELAPHERETVKLANQLIASSKS